MWHKLRIKPFENCSRFTLCLLNSDFFIAIIKIYAYSWKELLFSSRSFFFRNKEVVIIIINLIFEDQGQQ